MLSEVPILLESRRSGAWPQDWHTKVVGLLLFLHAVLLAIVAMIHSPAWDEMGHLPAGIGHLQTSRFELYRVNPPLVRMTAALTPFLLGSRLDFPGATVTSRALERNEFSVGERWMAHDPWDFMWALRLARLSCIPFSLLAGYLCYHTASVWFGLRSGRAALVLWCSSPLVLGHGALITPDVGSASLGLAAVLAFQKWVKAKTCSTACLGGTVLGLALLTKFTLLILLPLLGMICVVSIITEKQQRASRFGQAGLALLAMAYTINVGYGFENSFQPLGRFQFVSATFRGPASENEQHGNRFRETALASVPVPLPANYLYGIDVQRLDFEGRMSSYLAGVWQSKGWWYYYLYAWFVKEPLGTQLLLGLGVFGIFKSPRDVRRFSVVFLVLPAALLFGFVSSQTGFNHHLRYVFPAYPFLYVLAASVFSDTSVGPVRRSISWMALGWGVMASALVFPHSLSYFNELAGGPANGPKHLHNSNIDWGQDLLLLRRWALQHPEAHPLRVVFNGGFASSHIPDWGADVKHGKLTPREAVDLAQGKITGVWYAVSVGLIYDRPGEEDRYRIFRERKPDGMIGYSIYLFRL